MTQVLNHSCLLLFEMPFGIQDIHNYRIGQHDMGSTGGPSLSCTTVSECHARYPTVTEMTRCAYVWPTSPMPEYSHWYFLSPVQQPFTVLSMCITPVARSRTETGEGWKLLNDLTLFWLLLHSHATKSLTEAFHILEINFPPTYYNL